MPATANGWYSADRVSHVLAHGARKGRILHRVLATHLSTPRPSHAQRNPLGHDTVVKQVREAAAGRAS